MRLRLDPQALSEQEGIQQPLAIAYPGSGRIAQVHRDRRLVPGLGKGLYNWFLLEDNLTIV